MAGLSGRVRTLEQGRGYYPAPVVQEALQRIPTEELRSYEGMLRRVVEEGARAEEAEKAVNHVTRLCEEIEKERRREYRP